MGKTTSYGLTVSLTDVDANAITLQVPTGQSASDKLSMAAGGLLRDLAKGGQMIPPEYAVRIQDAIGTTDPPTITTVVEKSVNRDGDAILIPWRVDPTQITFYRHQAENAGITLEQQLKAHMDLAYAQGWLGSSAPDAFKVLFTPEQWRFLQGLLEKDMPTGEDVIDLLRKAAGAAGEDEDPVMDSLRGER